MNTRSGRRVGVDQAGAAVRGNNVRRGRGADRAPPPAAARGNNVRRGRVAARVIEAPPPAAVRGNNARRGNVYCGNNRSYAQQNGLEIGTKWGCLKRGVGFGLHMHDNDGPDANRDWIELYNNNANYQKIDERNFYCGNKPWNQVQNRYDLEGNLPMCFKKGTGVGLRLAAQAAAQAVADGRSPKKGKSSPKKKK